MASSYVFSKADDQATALVARYGAYSAGMQPPEVLDFGDSAAHLLHFRPVYARERYG